MKFDFCYRARLIFLCLGLLFVGCTSSVETIPPLVESQVVPPGPLSTNADQVTLTLTRIVLPSQTTTPIEKSTTTPKQITPTHTFTSIFTPLPPTWTEPSLSSEEAKVLVQELLETNGGCQLPCFWGITPGETTWQEAKSFLETFTLLARSEASENVRYLDAQIPFPVDLGTISHSYRFENDVVDSIMAYNGDLAQNFYLSNFLATYGQPGGIWIRTFREKEMNSQPFLLDIFYPDKGILMEYSGGDGVDLGDRLQNCFVGMDSPFIYLWSPDREMTFGEATGKFLDTTNFPKPIPLQEASGMDVKTFYDGFINGNTVCIETPKDLWP